MTNFIYQKLKTYLCIKMTANGGGIKMSLILLFLHKGEEVHNRVSATCINFFDSNDFLMKPK